MLNAKRNRTAVNVCSTNVRISGDLSRLELMNWVNDSLQAQFTKIGDLCTGAAYCQFMDMLFPDSVNMEHVKFFTNEEAHFIQNFKILEAGFKYMSVDMEIPIEKLIKGRYLDNLRFVKWFKIFFDANYEGRNYNPRLAREGAPMGFGPEPTLVRLWKRKTRKSLPAKVTSSPFASKIQWENIIQINEKPPGLIVKDFQSEKVPPGEPIHLSGFPVKVEQRQSKEDIRDLPKKKSSLKLKRSQSC